MLLAREVGGIRSDKGSIVGALGLSALGHLIPLVLIVMVMAKVVPRSTLTNITARVSSPATWIPETGGQSSGSGMPRTPEVSSTRQFPTRTPQPRSTITQSPAAMYDIPVVTLMPALQAIPGVVSPLTSVASADGTVPGGGDRAGTRGDGAGGSGGQGNTGAGGDLFHVGNGVTSPTLIKEVKPQYTSEAMRARIQGKVIMQVVVLPDGSVGTARVVRSLDTVFGLDQEALRAVRLWRFSPGRLGGSPVPVTVDIELTFALR